jgi:hypothetical protein
MGLRQSFVVRLHPNENAIVMSVRVQTLERVEMADLVKQGAPFAC